MAGARRRDLRQQRRVEAREHAAAQARLDDDRALVELLADEPARNPVFDRRTALIAAVETLRQDDSTAFLILQELSHERAPCIKIPAWAIEPLLDTPIGSLVNPGECVSVSSAGVQAMATWRLRDAT